MFIETASADHAPGAIAMIEGLSQREPSPGYFIHVSGTGMFHDVSNGFGDSHLSSETGDMLILPRKFCRSGL